MSEKLPLVSVIIPCYNTEKYVEQAVRSIMNQSYKNLEIIVTDDCSTDNSFEILKKLADEDSRIKLFRNESNLKIVKTLNKMIDLANGKYIARMDADDISLSMRIEKQVKFMEENPDFAICGTNAWIINENNSVIGKSYLPVKLDDVNIYIEYASPFFHPAVMLRASIFKKNLYNEKYLYAEDFELWKRILLLGKGSNLKEKLFAYRILNTSISRNKTSSVVQNNIKKDISRKIDSNAKKLRGLFVKANLISSNYSDVDKSFKFAFFYKCFYLIERLFFKLCFVRRKIVC